MTPIKNVYSRRPKQKDKGQESCEKSCRVTVLGSFSNLGMGRLLLLGWEGLAFLFWEKKKKKGWEMGEVR